MSRSEKILCLLALIINAAIFTLIALYPQLRQITLLIPISLVGLICNVGLMFIVFRDISLRRFPSSNHKYIWFALILFVWPAVLVYLPLFGFKKR